MAPGTLTAFRAGLRGRVMAAMLILFAAGLASAVPGPSAKAGAAMADTAAAPARGVPPVTAYVANSGSGTVTPIATRTNTARRPITTGSDPSAIAITPDGKTAYVANFGSYTVTPIATATNTPGPPITVSHPYTTDYLTAFAITPDGETIYVASDVSSDIADGSWTLVTPIMTRSNTAGPSFTAGLGSSSAIAITPDGKTAYVANNQRDTVTPIATATNTADPPITVAWSPSAIAITPDGKTAYVANWTPFAVGPGTVTPIATATNTAGAPITVGGAPPPSRSRQTERPPTSSTMARVR